MSHLVDRDGDREDEADGRLALQVLRYEGSGRCGEDGRSATELVRGLLYVVAPEAQKLTRSGDRMKKHAPQYYQTDGVELVLEGGDDPEVPTTAAQAPEEVLILFLACLQEPTVSGDHLG